MAGEFPILEVLSEMRGEKEQLGSKPKFWFRHADTHWLFKEARFNTGEDWAEKVASAIATLLGVETHGTELASCQGKRGCRLSRSCYLTTRSVSAFWWTTNGAQRTQSNRCRRLTSCSRLRKRRHPIVKDGSPLSGARLALRDYRVTE